MVGLAKVDDQLHALERENAALRRAIGLLHQIANLARESLELEPVCYAALTGVTAGVGLGFNRALLFFVDEDDGASLRGAAAVGPMDRKEADRVWRSIEADAPDLTTLYEEGLRRRQQVGALDQRVRELRVPMSSSSLVARAFHSSTAQLTGGAEPGDDLDGLLHPPTAVAAPLLGRHGIHGVLYADNRFTGMALDEITAQVFAMVAEHTGRAIENARRYEDVARAARTDALTGLGHHGALMDALRGLVDEAERQQSPLAVAMVDLDDFKQVNDTHGHPCGDQLLASAADRLRRAARAGSVYRYGGEEFTVLLPGATLGGAQEAAERLRQAVATLPFDLGGDVSVPVTCSIGVAQRAQGQSPGDLLQVADAALLSAKSQGKNRVVRAE